MVNGVTIRLNLSRISRNKINKDGNKVKKLNISKIFILRVISLLFIILALFMPVERTKADNQNTFPVLPSIGTTYTQVAIGRSIKYEYDGKDWRPIKSYGKTNVYVDAEDGVDDLYHGIGADTLAYKTINYAIDKALADDIGGTVIIWLSDSIYSENISITRKINLLSNDLIGLVINGTLKQIGDGIISGGIDGESNRQINVIPNSLPAKLWENKLLKFNGGNNNGIYRIIDKVEDRQIKLVGGNLKSNPEFGETFTIYDWGTTIGGYFEIVVGNGIWVEVNGIKLLGANSQDYGFFNCESTVIFNRDWANNNKNGFVTSTFGYSEVNQSLVTTTSQGWHYAIMSEFSSQVPGIEGSKLIGNGGSSTGVLAIHDSWAGILGGTVIDGFGTNVLASGKSYINAKSWGVNSIVRNSTVFGLQATSGSIIDSISTINLVNNHIDIVYNKDALNYIGD